MVWGLIRLDLPGQILLYWKILFICIAFASLKYFCRTAPHPTWLHNHNLTPTCPLTGSCHRLLNCLAVYLGETIGVQPALTRRSALYFTSCCRFSTYYTHLTCHNFICQHSAIVGTTVKQRSLTFVLFEFRCWESPVSHRTALFLAATKQLYKWYFLSVCLSVRPSVRLSHLFHHVPIIVSSWNFQELLPWSKVMSMQKVKVKGQGHRGQHPT